ncbi:MAG: vitamin B12-dependent ribonucleotide reductase, partial [Proteobacteria bacterium]|nr:vitamin B12-dependent ribonucleotide reductase [Pseudomonadota bacterium]
MKIERFFTRNLATPYEGITFESRKSEIKTMDGSVVSKVKKAVVPSFWSQMATDIISQKYFRKTGIPAALTHVAEPDVPSWLQRGRADEQALEQLKPEERQRGEEDSRDVFDRMAGCWTYWGFKYGYFDSAHDANAYRDEMAYMLAHQITAPNSPQWFNTGLNWAYGIDGSSQGHYYVDPKTGQTTASANAYERPQPHA